MQRLLSTRMSLVVLLIGLVIGGCSYRSSPPGPNQAVGTIDGAGYVFHSWQDGLAILVVYDTPGGFNCAGYAGSSDRVYKLTCLTEASDGRSISWVIETSDGLSARLNVGGNDYAISESVIFLMEALADGVAVRQINRDLSGLGFEHDSITTFMAADADISAFIRGLEAP
ncbi:MAG: hypothetical protein E4G99_13680 [Anaerolineales bacterium]|nr:MAG: hypothetical protein E4G99_13680 [Anaerolineales bacterium]